MRSCALPAAGDARLSPHPSHRDYIILKDLQAWLAQVAPATQGPVLDFGCGESPYRLMFPGRVYHRADLAGGEGLDFEIHPDETIDARPGSYGTILSIQVLEHVYLHAQYLRECHRLLAPGGRLLISTHGLFEEHGHPHDFRRWTLTALCRELENAGMAIERAHKLTVGPRALLYLLGSQIWKVDASRRTPLGFLLSGLKAFIVRYPHRWSRFVDRHFDAFGLRAGPAGDESLFIGIAVQAQKP